MTAPVSGRSSALRIWLLAARPRTLPASAVPVIVGGAMAYEAGSFDPLTFAVTLLAAILIQVATNFINDYFDHKSGADSAGRVGPLRVMQAGLVTPAEMRHAIAVVMGITVLLGAYLVAVGGWPIAVIGLLALLFAALYTAGPFPLAYIGLGDVFVLIFFGPVSAGGAYYLLAGTPTWPVLLVGTALGCISTGILVVNNLRDIPADRAAGKHTLAVRFGAGFARAEYLTLLTLGAVAPLIVISVIEGRLAVQLASLSLLAALPVIRTVVLESDGPKLNRALAATGQLLGLFAALFCLGWLWGA